MFSNFNPRWHLKTTWQMRTFGPILPVSSITNPRSQSCKFTRRELPLFWTRPPACQVAKERHKRSRLPNFRCARCGGDCNRQNKRLEVHRVLDGRGFWPRAQAESALIAQWSRREPNPPLSRPLPPPLFCIFKIYNSAAREKIIAPCFGVSDLGALAH